MDAELSQEHLKKSDEDDSDDSGAWSCSYPSYSRFTFTGKTKSRLGRSQNRLSQLTSNNKDNAIRLKSSDVITGSTDNVNTCNVGMSFQQSNTPGMNEWLQLGKLSSSNSFTPGNNLFKSSTAVYDSQISSNDSGVDISSQSNFLSTLKNDSVQNLNCKRNLAFNTPFKFSEENRRESTVKGFDQQFDRFAFPKLKFTDENKENSFIEQNPGQVSIKEQASAGLDDVQKRVKHTSDKGFGQFSRATLVENARNIVNNEKQLLAEPFSDREEPRVEDEVSNSPLDLSSGKCLTQENIVSRSFLSDRELSSEQQKGSAAEVISKGEVLPKEKSSSDGLSSILPTFLAPFNKSKVNEAAINDLSSVQLRKTNFDCPPKAQKEIPNPAEPVRDSVNSMFPASNTGSNGFKRTSSLPVALKTTNYRQIVQNTSNLRASKDNLISNQDPNENVAVKDYSKLSEIVNLSNCGNDENFRSSVPNTLSKPKADTHFQLSINGLKLNEMNYCKPNKELIVVEEKLKTVSESGETNEDYKNVPKNSVVNNVSCPDVSNNKVDRNTPHLNFNSKNPIPLSFHESIVSQKKSHDNQLLDGSVNPTVLQEAVDQRITKESRGLLQDQLVSGNLEHLPANQQKPIEHLQQGPGISQQKTYLAPQQPSYHRISDNFPHVKPDAPQIINSRSHCQAGTKSQNFKMPAPRGLLSRSNTELYVNGKVYTTLSMLGRGGSSEVYQVLDQRTSKLMAVKCVDLSMVDKTIAEGYLNEIDLLSKLQGCSSVIRMIDYEFVQEYKMLYVVMEKGDTDLSQLIRDISKTKKISMSMIIYYWTEMLTAVRDIHEKGIIHSDLKPANFLLVSGRLKLIDFGIASSQGDMTSVLKEVTTGTWNYMSPEAIKNNSASAKGFKITYKSDVWSLGCILYNLLYGKTPFSHITSTWSKLQAIADPNHQLEFPEVGAPLVLADALQSCLRREPKLRPTVAELLALPYHASGDSHRLAPQLRSILPPEWWTKISHLFQETQANGEDKD